MFVLNFKLAMKSNEIKKLIVIFVICVLIILCYQIYRCKNQSKEDPLLMKLGVFDLDGWSMTHVFFYILLGYIFPKSFFTLMVIGVF